MRHMRKIRSGLTYVIDQKCIAAANKVDDKIISIFDLSIFFRFCFDFLNFAATSFDKDHRSNRDHCNRQHDHSSAFDPMLQHIPASSKEKPGKRNRNRPE